MSDDDGVCEDCLVDEAHPHQQGTRAHLYYGNGESITHCADVVRVSGDATNGIYENAYADGGHDDGQEEQDWLLSIEAWDQLGNRSYAQNIGVIPVVRPAS